MLRTINIQSFDQKMLKDLLDNVVTDTSTITLDSSTPKNVGTGQSVTVPTKGYLVFCWLQLEIWHTTDGQVQTDTIINVDATDHYIGHRQASTVEATGGYPGGSYYSSGSYIYRAGLMDNAAISSVSSKLLWLDIGQMGLATGSQTLQIKLARFTGTNTVNFGGPSALDSKYTYAFVDYDDL